MAAYITGFGSVSPQGSWAQLSVPFYYEGNRLACIEPDYSQFVDIRQLRRMSRILKMGVAAGAMALKDAGITTPNGIITGTSYGCLEDTISFLTKMIENEESALNPTPFIQSTHNTIGSLIALLTQCQGYNQTYTQHAFSFENALLDAILELSDNPAQSLLVGGVDEITPVSHSILERFGIFRQGLNQNRDLFKSTEKGTIHGEGATYFVLSGEKTVDSAVSLESVETFYKPAPQDLLDGIEGFLNAIAISASDIDLVLIGKSGDRRLDHSADQVVGTKFAPCRLGLFKHLCGEYPTASAFAVWLGAQIIRTQEVPPAICSDAPQAINNVLIYNPYFGKCHSLILLRNVKIQNG